MGAVENQVGLRNSVALHILISLSRLICENRLIWATKTAIMTDIRFIIACFEVLLDPLHLVLKDLNLHGQHLILWVQVWHLLRQKVFSRRGYVWYLARVWPLLALAWTLVLLAYTRFDCCARFDDIHMIAHLLFSLYWNLSVFLIAKDRFICCISRWLQKLLKATHARLNWVLVIFYTRRD